MNTTARLCFLSDEPEDLVRAGLIDPRMPPICIAWLGAFMPVTKFAKLWSANRKTVQYLLTFSKGTRSFQDVRDEQDMIEKLSDEVKNELPAASRAAQEAARDAERSRAAQPKYESSTPSRRRRASPKERAKPNPRVRVQAKMIQAALAGRPLRLTLKGDGTQVHRLAVATEAGATAKDGERLSSEYQGYPKTHGSFPKLLFPKWGKII